jgi:hypothetical protein
MFPHLHTHVERCQAVTLYVFAKEIFADVMSDLEH